MQNLTKQKVTGESNLEKRKKKNNFTPVSLKGRTRLRHIKINSYSGLQAGAQCKCLEWGISSLHIPFMKLSFEFSA